MEHSHQLLHRRRANQHAHEAPDMREIAERQDGGTVLSVVYVTASATFTGEIAGYTTLSVSDTSDSSAAQTSSPQSSSQQSSSQQSSSPQSSTSSQETITTSTDSPDSSTTAIDTSLSSDGIFLTIPGLTSEFSSTSTTSSGSTTSLTAETSVTAQASSSSSFSSALSSPSSSTLPSSSSFSSSSSLTYAVATTLVTSTASYSQSTHQNSNTAVAAASATAISQASTSKSTQGMSTGGKIGLAVGIIVALVAIAGCVLWLYWKKQKQNQGSKIDDEKATLATAAAANMTRSKSSATAPRLSLRPMSNMMRFSQGNPLNMVNQPSGASAAKAGRNLTPSPRSGSPWERKAAGSPENQINPFNDPQNPFTDPEKVNAPPANATADVGSAVAGAAGLASVTAGAAFAARAANARQANEQSTDNLSPDAAILGSAPASNVYRVHLDFMPSMDDELELRAGQLIRLVHEYDDGWALCVRLDRSQQGVAPRTCLSTKPCKPRPSGPGNGPPRGPSPQNAPRLVAHPLDNGRMSPAMNRPMSSASARGGPRNGSPPQQFSPASPGSFNQAPRPLSPGPHRPQQKRSMSPGPYGPGAGPRPMVPPNQRRRSNSAGGPLRGHGGRQSPGPSKLGPGNGGAWPLPTVRAPGVAM